MSNPPPTPQRDPEKTIVILGLVFTAIGIIISLFAWLFPQRPTAQIVPEAVPAAVAKASPAATPPTSNTPTKGKTAPGMNPPSRRLQSAYAAIEEERLSAGKKLLLEELKEVGPSTALLEDVASCCALIYEQEKAKAAVHDRENLRDWMRTLVELRERYNQSYNPERIRLVNTIIEEVREL